MTKVLSGIILGLVIGATATMLVMRHPAEAPGDDEKPAAKAPQETALHLTKEQQILAGIAVAQLKAVEVAPKAGAFGRVLDPANLATLLAEIATARSELDLVTKEFQRLKTLGENASARALETAEAAVRRNQIALDSSYARLLTDWGSALATRPDLESLTRSLLTRESALARVAIPPGDAVMAPPFSIRIASAAGGGSPQEAELIGPAPAADPFSPGPAYLVLTHGRTLPPGTPVTAWISKRGTPQHGCLLPRGALIQYEGDMFVFVQTGDESFQRKRVETSQSQREGIVVTNGLSTDDHVVVTGAQQLLSEEFKSASSPQ